MGMNDWYQRQFGDREHFAVSVSLGRDPHPSGVVERDATFGTLEIWARGHCLTRSVSDGGGVQDGVQWTLLPILEWILGVGVRLVNEDPYPRFSKGIVVPDGSAWFDATISPPMLDAEAERRWFLRRSEWRHHHALRRAAEEVSLPNLVFRRIGDQVEVSWDNDAWSPPRQDLSFVERRGRSLVDAQAFASILLETVRDVAASAAARSELPALRSLAARAVTAAAAPEDWRWLVHRPTARVIRDAMPALRARLDAAAAERACGLFVPHTRETHVLRLVRLETHAEVLAVLAAAERLPQTPVTAALQALICPRPASAGRPWEEGNDYAEHVRDCMGWGDAPLPDLDIWLAEQGCLVATGDQGLPPAVSVLAERTADARAMVHVNPKGGSQVKKETGLAAALGHVLLDDAPVAVDGDWEHWPTSARARAFAVALTLPEGGIRDALGGARSIGPIEVRRIMHDFRAGPWATTYRLKNLGLISADERAELVAAVA